MTDDFVKQINLTRATHGFDPVAYSSVCESGAMRNAKRVARTRGRLWHPGSPRAEIAARGQATIEEAIQSWLDSSGHRAILLGSYLNCGVASVPSSRGGDIVWFSQFE